MIFETERFIVREWTENDAEAAYRLYGDPEVLRFLGAGDTPPDASLDEAERKMPVRAKHWRTNDLGFGMWAIEEKGGALVGSVGLFPLAGKGPEIEVAYHVARDEWGRGIAAEAARGAIEHAFAKLGLDEVVAVVYRENPRSLRVAEKLGMTRGEDREYMGKTLAFFSIARTA